jgi:NhaA family Na+:H+ antiporter
VLSRVVRFILDRSLLLVAGAIAALVWANAWPASYARFTHAVHFPVNDVAMVFFFAIAAKEIVEATLPGGALASPRAAAVPLLAAAAGMIVPAGFYWTGSHAIGHPELARGWAIPCATDIAFSYLVARLVFPPRHAALPFLLLLAVADDALGLLVLAVFYPAGTVSLLAFVMFMIPALAIAWGLRRTRVSSFWPYVFGAGPLSWLAFYMGGLHPALALVPIVPFMRAEPRYHDLFERTAPRHEETLNVFAAWARVPVEIVLLFFGLANAGVPLASIGPPTWLVSGALVLGKPIGIVLMTVIAVRAGLARPAGMTYADVLVVGVAAGIGFTVALFFATAAFPPGPALDAAKMGALLSFIAAPLALGVGKIAGSTNTGRRRGRA